jgi:hypothetical protein
MNMERKPCCLRVLKDAEPLLFCGDEISGDAWTEAQNDVFNVFTHVSGFSQSGGIHNRKRNTEQTRQSLSEKRLPGSGWSD